MKLAGSEEYYAATVAKMQKIIPDFKLVPHEESARHQIELLNKLTAADSGSFLLYDGKVSYTALLNKVTSKPFSLYLAASVRYLTCGQSCSRTKLSKEHLMCIRNTESVSII